MGIIANLEILIPSPGSKAKSWHSNQLSAISTPVICLLKEVPKKVCLSDQPNLSTVFRIGAMYRSALLFKKFYERLLGYSNRPYLLERLLPLFLLV